jgi:hypothetical protein
MVNLISLFKKNFLRMIHLMNHHLNIMIFNEFPSEMKIQIEKLTYDFPVHFNLSKYFEIFNLEKKHKLYFEYPLN